MDSPHLVGSVFERTSVSKPSPPIAPGTNKGFPEAAHRTKKSAFVRAREAKNSASSGTLPKDRGPPTVFASTSKFARPSASARTPSPPTFDRDLARDADDWRTQMSLENERKVESMTEEEREEERREILSKFGPHIGDILKKAKAARAKTSTKSALSPASPEGSRPESRASKKIRFAEVTADDVHVYESAPSSPKHKALALPPPDGSDDVVSLGEWKGSLKKDPEEGTPEDIRQRFFPSTTPNHPDLEWMQDSAPVTSLGSSSPPDPLRFDLSGNVLETGLHSSLPTHLGLHHHAPDADGMQRAGYTLEDVFVMSRSSVKAQRAAGMRMLVGVARWIGTVHRGDADLPLDSFLPSQIPEIKQRVIASGIEAMSERGSLGAHAIEVVRECVVGWSPMDFDSTLVEFGGEDALLPRPHLLQQIVGALSTQAEGSDSSSDASLAHLLVVLTHLSHQTNEIATEIISTPSLIVVVFRAFLLAGSRTTLPNAQSAINLIVILAASSRANAQALLGPSDALLRFAATLPPAEATLLTSTLVFYRTLATYGLYSSIASTAHLQFAALAAYVPSAGASLQQAWASLLETWLVCATDPHQTTPEHEILWSQIEAWGWGADLLALRDHVTTEDALAWTSMWNALAAWLEGARVNGVRSGENERAECLGALGHGFESGKERDVVEAALRTLETADNPETLGTSSQVLSAAIRLWLTFPNTSFTLPIDRISELCGKLVVHPVWKQSSGRCYFLLRPLSSLLCAYLDLSKRLQRVSQDAWTAQALSILSRTLPGDELFALDLLKDVLGSITPEWANSRGIKIPPSFWEKGGFRILQPFIENTVQPRSGVQIGPLNASPASIKVSTTQRLPTYSRGRGLPLSRAWALSPLDHLLRSGTSPVFRSLPAAWDATETEVTRATLLLAKITRELVTRFSFADFVPSREEVVFGCMKVFMLEHEQPHTDSDEEVF
ncbi:unnamed protein product, partial [Mycena citricolor]